MTRTVRALTSIALAAALAFVSGCSGGDAPAAAGDAARAGPVEGIQVGNLAPDFALQDADGRTVRLADYRGKVVLVEFSAMW